MPEELIPQDPPLEQTDPSPTDPTPPAPPVEDLWEVKVNGKTFKVPRDEVVAGYQRQQDYTRKTAQLAEERRALEKIRTEHEQFAKEREQLRAFLQDRAAIQEYLRQLEAAADPNNPASTAAITPAQIQRLIAQQQRAMEQRMAQMTAEMEIRQTAAAYASEIDNTIKAVLNQYPELKSVRRIDHILKAEVAERQPGSIEEVKQLLPVIAKEQAEALRAFVAEEKKKSVASKEQLQNGIEPPGGTGLQPAPQKLKLGDPAILKAFEDALREA